MQPQQPEVSIFLRAPDLSHESIVAEATRQRDEYGWGPESQTSFEERVREERLGQAFRVQLATYSDESLLDDVKGDLVDAAGRYIANDDLHRARRNPQIACEAHMYLGDLWLGFVASRPIESERDVKGKLRALLHYLATDGQIELHGAIEEIVDQLRAHEGATS